LSSAGNKLLLQLAALASPHRLRVIAALQERGRNYVSQLARELKISRPLLHLHLQKLEDAGLIRSELEISEDGKALKYFEVVDFSIALNATLISKIAKSITTSD
jgi:DNA-binding transcriptional ArsR family regulator